MTDHILIACWGKVKSPNRSQIEQTTSQLLQH